jgi:hypothetical protein
MDGRVECSDVVRGDLGLNLRGTIRLQTKHDECIDTYICVILYIYSVIYVVG